MKKIVSVVLLVVWMGVIYYFSAQPGDISGETSGGLLSEIATFLNITDVESFVSRFGVLFRKFAHFSEYFILGFLVYFCLKQYTKQNVILIVLLLSALYATSDELHQLFVVGRYFAFTDILIDSFGALCGNLSFHLLHKICCQEKKL